MSSSVHVDNKNKDTLILVEGPTQGLDDTALTTEAEYPINFIHPRKRFVLSLHYNGSNGFLFANTTKVYQFKAKNSEIKEYALCLGNVSKGFPINNLKKTELKESVNFFLLTLILLILDIHKCLMKGKWYKIMLEIILKMFIGLLTGLVNGSNHTKCASLSNPK